MRLDWRYDVRQGDDGKVVAAYGENGTPVQGRLDGTMVGSEVNGRGRGVDWQGTFRWEAVGDTGGWVVLTGDDRRKTHYEFVRAGERSEEKAAWNVSGS